MQEHHVVTIFLAFVGCYMAMSMIIAVLGSVRRGNVFQVGRVRWFRTPSNRPAVYILRSKSDPSLFKVGYTSRRVEARAAEISATRGQVEIVGWLRMPHAYAVEQRAHARLRRSSGVRDMGNEWYRVSKRGGENYVRSVLRSESKRVRTIARVKFAWPEDGRIVWGSPVR